MGGAEPERKLIGSSNIIILISLKNPFNSRLLISSHIEK